MRGLAWSACFRSLSPSAAGPHRLVDVDDDEDEDDGDDDANPSCGTDDHSLPTGAVPDPPTPLTHALGTFNQIPHAPFWLQPYYRALALRYRLTVKHNIWEKCSRYFNKSGVNFANEV